MTGQSADFERQNLPNHPIDIGSFRFAETSEASTQRALQPSFPSGHYSHKHGKTSKGSQRYFCRECRQSFTETFDTLYYRRQVTEEDVRIVLQSHAEGSSLRGISRISGLAYDTVASIVRAASEKAQMVHNAKVHVDTDAIAADELWSFVEKNKNTACPTNSLLEIAG